MTTRRARCGVKLDTHGRTRGAVVGAVALVLFAASACSSASSSSGSSGGTPTVTIWNDALASGSCGVSAADSFLTKAVTSFLKTNPGFNVKIIQEQCDATTPFNTLLQSSETAGTTPDIGQLYVGGQVIQNGKYLVNLRSALGADYINSLSGWKYVTDGYGTKTNGAIYGVPFGQGYWYSVYYNKAMLAKAGITNPAPATWDDLLALGRQVKAAGMTPFSIGEKEGYVGAWTQDALISGLVGDDGVLQMYNGKASLNSPTLTKPYNAWHQLFAEGLTNPDAPSLPQATGTANFAAGKTAMTITAGFYNSTFTKSLGTNNVGLFPVPVLAGSQFPQSLSGGPNNSYVVFKNTKNLTDDIKLLKYLTTEQVQVNSVDELGQLPNNVSFTPSAQFQTQQPLLTSIYDYVLVKKYALGEAFDNIMPGTVCSYWYQTNSGVFGGSISPASAATSMQTQMQSYLATAATG